MINNLPNYCIHLIWSKIQLCLKFVWNITLEYWIQIFSVKFSNLQFIESKEKTNSKDQKFEKYQTLPTWLFTLWLLPTTESCGLLVVPTVWWVTTDCGRVEREPYYHQLLRPPHHSPPRPQFRSANGSILLLNHSNVTAVQLTAKHFSINALLRRVEFGSNTTENLKAVPN